MTDKEIISSLRGLIGKYNFTDEEWQTVEKTIEVLSNSDEDCISRTKVLEGKVIHQSCDGVEIIDSYAVPVEYIKNLPSIQPKTDVLDKIRTEIKEYRDSMRWNSESLVKWEAINYVLEHIIDKYRTESEDKE